MKLYAESKIKPTKINKTIVKLLSKQYPQLVEAEFFKYKETSTDDKIYVLDFNNIELSLIGSTSVFSLKYNGEVIEGLTLQDCGIQDGVRVYKIISDHWKNESLKQKRTIVVLNDDDFNDQIDKAVDSTKALIDKLEYRVKRLKKIDWKV